jgi:hypothetical protein
MAEIMFVCSICKRVTQPRVPQHKLTTYRDATYPMRVKPVLTKQGQPVYRNNGKIPKWKETHNDYGHLMEIIDFDGCGREIAQEIPVCPLCR